MDEETSRGVLSRREFLGLGAATGAALGSLYFLRGSPEPEEAARLYAALTPEQERQLGEEVWYPTGCGECPGGCSLLVRVMEGRAKVVEGNPLSPVNHTNTCARGQASVQGLYNPDRIQQPRRRSDGSWTPVPWERALEDVTGFLGEAEQEEVLVVSKPERAHLGWLLRQFSRTWGGSDPVYWHPYRETSHRRSVRDVLGTGRLPYREIERADCLVSFGARFLETWLSPVQFSRAYGRFRQGDPDAADGRDRGRGTHLHVEPRLSATAASADHWIPVKPGTEGVLARWLAGRVSAWNPGADPGPWLTGTEPIDRERAAAVCEVPERKLTTLERALKRARRPLFLGGGSAGAHEHGTRALARIEGLNVLAGNTGETGGVHPNPPALLRDLDRFSGAGGEPVLDRGQPGFRRLNRIGRSILEEERRVRVLLVHDLDLVYQLPASSPFREAMEKIDRVVALSSFPDETVATADYVLPVHTSLERWGDDVPDPGTGRRVYSLSQPVVSPYYDTKHPGTILLALMRRGERRADDGSEWDTFEDMLREDLEALHRRSKPRLEDVSSGQFLEGLIAKGGWYPAEEDRIVDPPEARSDPIATDDPPEYLSGDLSDQPAGNEEEYPFHLLPYESSLLRAGEGANRPWLQQSGDPVTTVAWQSWVEVNPARAGEMDLEEGDLVRVVSAEGSIEVPVYPYEGIRPDTVAVPCGQGHENHGRYARDRGANPLSILGSKIDPISGQLAWMGTRVRLEKTGKSVELPSLEGSEREMGRDVIRRAAGSGIEKPVTRKIQQSGGESPNDPSG